MTLSNALALSLPPLAATGWSVFCMLLGGAVLGALLIFVATKLLQK